jgi:iron complex outermembrane recepter protein
MNWDGGASGVGPTAPSSGATLTWNGSTFVALSNGELAGFGPDGTRNIVNPLALGWYTTFEDANRAVITVDQRLTRNISFYGEGYYSNRRSKWLNPPHISFTENAALTMPVPTFNPYYPVGYTGTPLRVSYTTIAERETQHPAHSLDARYLFGLNIGLPAGWAGEAHWAYTISRSHQQIVNGAPNKNAVSAALGWTIGAQSATGTTPGIATWTKPTTVPYLNLFCDPTQFVCNSDLTLNYMMGYRSISSNFAVNEKSGRVDGPLFDLPAGPVKAAIGASYTTYNFGIREIDTRQSQNLLVNLNDGQGWESFWAVFTQVNVPLIGDDNRLPLVAGLELELSWRHDQYSDVGGTSNPKVAFNWRVIDDFTIRGGWGQSFRAPSFGETNETITFTLTGWNLPPTVAPANQAIGISCAGGVPTAGSGAEKVFNMFSGPYFVCTPGAALNVPGGLQLGGSSTGAISHGARDIVNTEQQTIEPERATNWSLGFDYTPSTGFLQGLNIQATWYRLKVNGVLTSIGQINPNNFNDPANGFRYIAPADLGCDSTGVAPGTPPVTWCAPFAKLVDTLLTDPRVAPTPAGRTLVHWVTDTAIMNLGYERLEGIDFTASYDWEWGNLGAFNVGITGSYYLDREQLTQAGLEPVDPIHTTINVVGIPLMEGVNTQPILRYRARVGWANGGWSITGFFNYRSHYWTNAAPPPNVNNQCQTEGGTVGGGTFPCAISNYVNHWPPIYSFDLSIGYDTGDRPANEYLRNIGFQLVVQNLMNKHPPWSYLTGNRPGAWATGQQGGANEINGLGRTISMILTKTW